METVKHTRVYLMEAELDRLVDIIADEIRAGHAAEMSPQEIAESIVDELRTYDENPDEVEEEE